MNLLFAWRYFRSKKSTNAINIIAWISIAAIAVGSAALIIILSVFNGFEGLVKSLYVDFYADMRIVPAKGKTLLLNKEQVAGIRATSGITTLGFIAEEKALLVNGELQTIVYIKGVDEQFTQLNKIAAHIKRGRFETGTTEAPTLVLGVGIENAIAADVTKKGYPLTLYMPNRQAARFGSADGLNAFNALAAGTFMVQQDFDNKYAFTNLAFLKYMLNMGPDEYSALELKINSDPDQIKAALQKQLGNDYIVETRYEQNRSLYAVMQMEKWVIYGILSLILIVAAFNMVGALTMLVLEKQKDIAILKALGANDQNIERIFLSEGFLLATVGGGAGIVLATIICWLQMKYKLVKLGGDTFIIDYYPVQMMPTDFALVACTILIIALLAAWIPSRKAGRDQLSLKS
ncbi:lipoprotein-releasing system permease protein [Hydrobacter penzbergensis]|jgi:lipoprotein-releasing system permease protein|uniref:Lipoprotein-releasing system permease protein n=1 Tax=Hydrobacter penzbergensis TaxID=1235997 RepID=A0A8X8IDR1_9BACT|nr:FtsX-like permease family protein [Hydrobacter penzbergensis]MBN8719336.1 ABC transporter permease [Sediminibacterium magnilacihabitans]PQV60640.1 lipoprotein-releasing system permease protein [Sediminibacterium magnilacihabitans]SDW36671.1 lipoprotein-releasing system permease protein [Hydrobacter penzbergensis]